MKKFSSSFLTALFTFTIAAFLTTTVNVTASATVVDDGLIGYWTFDDEQLDEIKSTINPTANAKANQDVPRVDGVFGKAADLSGKPRIEISREIIPHGLKQLTFSAWIAPNSLDSMQPIFRKEDAGAEGTYRILFALQAEPNKTERFLTLGLNTGENYAELDAVITKEELVDGNWHLIAATFDGKFMRVYLDGREIGSFERQSSHLRTGADYRGLSKHRDFIASGNGNIENATVFSKAYIGSLLIEERKGSPYSEQLNGKIDDLRFYSKALSQNEITELFALGKGKIPNHVIDAETIAKELYAKSDSFDNTLKATRELVAAKPDINDLVKVALLRIIRKDYPAEVNAYIMKWQRNPVDLMTLGNDKLLERVKGLAEDYFEYLPVTEMQWNNLSEPNRKIWQTVKENKTIYDNLLNNNNNNNTPTSSSAAYRLLADMERLVEYRPRRSEAVAPHAPAQTPETKDRNADEAKKLSENEWLFQAQNKPTIELSLKEIEWTKFLAKRIENQYPNQTNFDNELKKLNELEREAKNANAADENKELYFAIRAVKRDIMLKNPVLDFDSLLFVDGQTPRGSEWNHETRHRLGYMAVPGGRLITMKGLKLDGTQKQTKIMPQEPIHGSFWRPDLSYDAKKIIFSFKPHNEKTFHIYEINVDGTGLRQLTGGMFDDLDPIYLPDGKNFMFITSRGHIYVRCMPPTNAYVTAKMGLDSKELFIISRNGEPEYLPSIMNDGKVIFTRWEYTDKPLWRCQSLWTMNTDGTQVQTFWGNQSVWPDLLKDARQIPNSERVMFIGSAHHNWYSGCIGIIDPSKGFNFPDGLTKVTQELRWPESGNGPVDPVEVSKELYHTAGNYDAYISTYPLSDTDFLVSGKRQKGKWVLLLMDIYGNRELIHEGHHHIFDAQPLRSRPVPSVRADTVNWPTMETRNRPETGIIYSNNVYEKAPEELKGKVKYLRIWSIDHKTYTYWSKRNYVSSGPEISMNQSEGIKKIIGTVSVEEDGSVQFNAPSGIALHFQILDENYRALQTMRSFTGVQPGESRGCLGCHESHVRAPVVTQTGKALKRPASNITPVSWEDITVSFPRYVQPVLDKYCGKCHGDPANVAYKKFNSTSRPGFLGFREPYITLLGCPTWGAPYSNYRGSKDAPFGWADTLLVEAFGQRDPEAYSTFPPTCATTPANKLYPKLSYGSRLVKRMSSGEHHGVKVTGDDLMRVILWIDAMGPYYGAEELRQFEDPIFQGKDWISQRPRVTTAPIVPRPGPFNAMHPELDNAYGIPEPHEYNALPHGVVREKK
ncbi:MAG: hypothetical protein LBQ66_13275 [Planctomycetaceae bacterium]|jgi:hypothetical protein|nr:hypothetical protein [Planctomycetaceae bacterium]